MALKKSKAKRFTYVFFGSFESDTLALTWDVPSPLAVGDVASALAVVNVPPGRSKWSDVGAGPKTRQRGMSGARGISPPAASC